MSAIKPLNEKVRVLNNTTKYPVEFLDASGSPAAAAAATTLKIGGYGQWNLAQMSKISISRGLSPQINQWNLQFGVTSPTANRTVFLVFDLETPNREMSLARYAYEFGIKDVSVSIKLDAADTADSVADKFQKAIDGSLVGVNHRDREKLLAATVDTATTPDTLEIQAQPQEAYQKDFRGIFLKNFRVQDERGDTDTEITLVSTTEVAQANKGINYGADIEFTEKMQFHNLAGYEQSNQDVPASDELYTAVLFNYQYSRKSPKISEYDESRPMLFFLRESTCETIIDNLADFFLTTPATRATSLTATGLSVSYNDSTAVTNNAAVSSATNLNSAHGTLTPVYGAIAGTDPKYLQVDSVLIDDTLETFILAAFKANA